jgi:hypothetical protein
VSFTRPSSTPSVRAIGEADADAWHRFIEAQPGAGPYHTILWRDVIAEVFGHRPCYLACERDGVLTGVLPLFHVRLPPLRSKLVSLPYDMGWGGPLAADQESTRALAAEAVRLARRLGVGHLQLRCSAKIPGLEELGFRLSRPVLLTRMELTDEETVWKGVGKGHRDSLRTAHKRGTTVRAAESEQDVEAFYRIYLRGFREFGTPPYGRRYFRTLWRRLRDGGHARLGLASAGDHLLGGLLLLRWGGVLVNKFTICLPEGRVFDFGTSSRAQEGLLLFKERWGGTSTEVHLYRLAVRGSVPDLERYYDQDGLKRRLWRKMPLPLTSLLGHQLNRWFC